MKRYSYQEFAEEINKHLENIPDAQVTVRTVKFWVEAGLLPGPKGGSRWRFFEVDDLHEAVSIRKLQVKYGQSNEDIKKLSVTASINPHTLQSGNSYNLSKLVAAVESIEKIGGNSIPAIEKFKAHKLLLVWDDAHMPTYRLIEEDQLSDSYLEENGKVYRKLQYITDEEGKVVYFRPAQIEKYISRVNAMHREFVKGIRRIDAKAQADKIRELIDAGIMTTPRYRFKGEDYFFESDIEAGEDWLNFIEGYGLSYADLKLLRSRIEADIENFFYAPEEGLFVEAPIYYEFRKQVTLINSCIGFLRHDLFEREDTVVGHRREDSLRLIRDYIEGFFFLCSNFTGENCIKRTPIDRLSAKQIKTSLSKGKFTQREVALLLRAKEAEVRALKAIVNKSLKGAGK